MANFYTPPQYQTANPLYNTWAGQMPNGYSATNIAGSQTQNQQNYLNNIMVVPVSGQENAEAYPVAIGLTVMLLDYNNGIFWLKTNDGLTTKLVKHIFTVEQPEKAESEKVSDFVSKNDFDALSETVKSLSSTMDKLLENLGEGGNVDV